MINIKTYKQELIIRDTKGRHSDKCVIKVFNEFEKLLKSEILDKYSDIINTFDISLQEEYDITSLLCEITLKEEDDNEILFELKEILIKLRNSFGIAFDRRLDVKHLPQIRPIREVGETPGIYGPLSTKTPIGVFNFAGGIETFVRDIMCTNKSLDIGTGKLHSISLKAGRGRHKLLEIIMDRITDSKLLNFDTSNVLVLTNDMEGQYAKSDIMNVNTSNNTSTHIINLINSRNNKNIKCLVVYGNVADDNCLLNVAELKGIPVISMKQANARAEYDLTYEIK